MYGGIDGMLKNDNHVTFIMLCNFVFHVSEKYIYHTYPKLLWDTCVIYSLVYFEFF